MKNSQILKNTDCYAVSCEVPTITLKFIKVNCGLGCLAKFEADTDFCKVVIRKIEKEYYTCFYVTLRNKEGYLIKNIVDFTNEFRTKQQAIDYISNYLAVFPDYIKELAKIA